MYLSLPYLFHAMFLLRSCHLAQIFTEEEIAHVLLPRAGVINSYVVQVNMDVVSQLQSSLLLECNV
jgi:hypothetical protein